jgi:hypothetical protein
MRQLSRYPLSQPHKSGSQASASTVPSLRAIADAVTTGRRDTASSPAAGAASPAVTVPPL